MVAVVATRILTDIIPLNGCFAYELVRMRVHTDYGYFA